jgi:putative hydrolase of the HAD superfamily
VSLKAILLDAGGTLLREEPSRAAIYAEAARRRGIDLDDRTSRALMYRVLGRLPRRLGGHFRYSTGWFEVFIEKIFREELGLPAAEVPALQAELIQRFADPATFRLHPGAIELCERLRGSGLCVGVASNWSEALPGILAGLGLAERLDFIAVSSLLEAEKPEPEFFERALALAAEPPARVRPGEALHAGNDPVQDVRGAWSCGLQAVLVDHRGLQSQATLPEGVPTVRSLPELERWITARLT